MKKLIIKSKHIAKKNSSNYKHEKKQGTKDLQNSEKAIKWQQQILINSYFKVNELNSLIRRHNSQMDFLKQIEKEKSGEQDGRGVGGRGAVLCFQNLVFRELSGTCKIWKKASIAFINTVFFQSRYLRFSHY